MVLPDKGRAQPFENLGAPLTDGDGAPGDKWPQTSDGMSPPDNDFSSARPEPPPREKGERKKEEEKDSESVPSLLQDPFLHEAVPGEGSSARQKGLGQEPSPMPSTHTPVGEAGNPLPQGPHVTPSTPTEKMTVEELQGQGLPQAPHMALTIEASPAPPKAPWTRKVSEMTLEAAKERRLREALDGIRQHLAHASEARSGVFDRTSFVAAFRSKQVVARWFTLHDDEGRGVLQQQDWIERSKSNSRNEATQEWTELLEVLAYVLCGEEGEVSQETFGRILTSRKVLDSLFNLMPKNPEGLVKCRDVMDFLSAYTCDRPRTGFTKENLESFEQLFRQALGKKDELGFEDFKKIVRSKNPFFARRVFQIFDRDNSGTVSLTEFLDAIYQYVGQSPEDKIKFLFKVYDLDGDGSITEDELEEVLRACMHESGVSFSEEHIGDLTDALFEDAGVDENEAITYEDLRAQLGKHDGLIENLSISIDRWLVPPEPVCETKPSLWKRLKNLHPYQMTLPYLKNNFVYLVFLVAYIIVSLGLFIARVYEYREENGYTIVARGCGQLLNFNCVFVLVLMLRQTITFLRTHGAAAYLPLDQHLYLHKMVGGIIFILSLIHTLAHLCNFSLNVQPGSDFTLAEWLLTARPEKFGLVEGVANPTGVALIIILTVMVICSLPFVRKSGYFEVFYWTHLLYIVFWILVIFHGPNFWKWFIGPGLIFVIERFVRIVNMRTGHGKTYISSGALLPSRVTHLVIKRPTQFDFHPGDYVFINIPAIAKYEWHPFTFSSAPEHHDVIWLHVRAVGEWTKRLYDYFEKEQHRCEVQLGQVEGSPNRRSRLPLTTRTSHLSHQSINSNVEGGDKCLETGTPAGKELGVGNPAFDPDPDLAQLPDTLSPVPEIQVRSIMKNPSTPNLFINVRKQPLDKSQSVPDIGRRAKKREKQLIMRNLLRANSEHGFHEGLLRTARRFGQTSTSLLANPASKSLAHSFRYMRRKPAIINLELPDEDEADDNDEDGSPSDNVTTELEGVDISSAWKDIDILPAEEDVAARAARREEARRKRKSRLESRRKLAKEQAVEEGICLPGEPLVIYMDGPYGAPSSHIFRAQHAVLIGTGIGVTPFASILQSIMHKYWKAKNICPKCEYSWTNNIPASVMNLRKVDFFWINRDQKSFEWFVNLLSQLEIEQAEQGGTLDRFLDMHMYITSALKKTDMKAVSLQLALDLLHEKEKRDLITGLKTRTTAGRPNWDKVFRQLSNMKKGKITVFYCGPPTLARILRFKCDEYGFDFRKEIF